MNDIIFTLYVQEYSTVYANPNHVFTSRGIVRAFEADVVAPGPIAFMVLRPTGEKFYFFFEKQGIFSRNGWSHQTNFKSKDLEINFFFVQSHDIIFHMKATCFQTLQ